MKWLVINIGTEREREFLVARLDSPHYPPDKYPGARIYKICTSRKQALAIFQR